MRCPGLIPTAILLLAAGGASAGTVNLPLDPAGLAGPGIFTAAPRQVARAAEAAGLTFTAANYGTAQLVTIAGTADADALDGTTLREKLPAGVPGAVRLFVNLLALGGPPDPS